MTKVKHFPIEGFVAILSEDGRTKRILHDDGAENVYELHGRHWKLVQQAPSILAQLTQLTEAFFQMRQHQGMAIKAAGERGGVRYYSTLEPTGLTGDAP